MKNLQKFIEKEVIKISISNEYVLSRPLKMVIKKNVIEKLTSIYDPSYEKGGILVFELIGKSHIECNQFIEVANLANNGFTYSPSKGLLEYQIATIYSNGNLPIVLHTHPTRIGIESYDTKGTKFFLKPSTSDKKIARNTGSIFMPEAIFVKNANDYSINFYTGSIFKSSFLSTIQIIALVGSIVFSELFALFIIVFGYEFTRYPKIEKPKNGDFVLTLSK